MINTVQMLLTFLSIKTRHVHPIVFTIKQNEIHYHYGLYVFPLMLLFCTVNVSVHDFLLDRLRVFAPLCF